ncbi:MAG: InlB B-repeat-containing protein [Salinivirgaceae bacterium]|nr:InlB B-repeat-containing protein [Salinivirgaceae bacterium]
MKNILSKAFMAVCLTAMTFAAVAQNSFNYQAVIRDGGKVLENKAVSLRLSVMSDDSVCYQEKHSVTSNAYGNVSLNVGEGTPLTGSFAAIPWGTMRVMLQVEVSTDGSDNYTNMGSMQIMPVPYALYAAHTSVIQPAVASDEPIFQVKDNAGNLMFAVYETGVKVFVDADGSKAAKSKFAVAGLSAEKGEQSLLTINADGTTVYVDDNSKAAKSKFAVAGQSADKTNYNLLTIGGSGSTVYVGGEGKAAKSKFAVAGYSANKAAENNYSIDGDGSTVYVDFTDNSKGSADVLSIDGSQATFYVDDTKEGKAAKSRFAVAGLSADKSVDTTFVIDAAGALIYIDDIEDADKIEKSTFTVVGSSGVTNNYNDKFFTINRDSTRIYINDKPDNTGTVTTPSLASAFSVANMTQNRDLLKVSKDSAVVRTGVYVAEEVQSTEGGVEKLIDDSKASKYYSTGKINLFVEKMEGFETINSGFAQITYTYYHSNAGEYLYLDNNWADYHEYRNYWLVNGKIYKDTTFMLSADRMLMPFYESGMIDDEKEEDFTPADWNGENLLVILESKMKESGYNALNFEGVNHYYKEEDNEEVMLAKRNVVTSLSDAGVFTDNLTVFKILLNPLYTISSNECNLLEDRITELMWSSWNNDEDGSYGYILIDDEVEEGYIIEKEKLQHSIDTTPQTESEIYANDQSLLCKHTLAEIESKLSAINDRYSVKVAVSDKNNGTVTVKYGKNTKTNTSVSITRSYCQNITLMVETNTTNNYIFAGWSDGNKDNPRNMFVMRDINLTANIVKGYLVDIQSAPYGHVVISCNGEEETCNGGSNIEKMYLEGETITLTAVPEGDDCVFTGWSAIKQSGSPIVSTEPTYNVAVSDELSLKAVFTKSFTATNAEELNAAINSMYDGGTYNIYIDSDEKITGINAIEGDKEVNIIGVGDNVVLGCTHYTSIISINGANVTIKNLTIDGLYGQNNKGSVGVGTNYSKGVPKVTIENVKIMNVEFGISCNSESWVYINSGTEITNNKCGIHINLSNNTIVSVRGGTIAGNSGTDIYYPSAISPHDSFVYEKVCLDISGDAHIGTVSMDRSSYYPNWLQSIHIGPLTYHTADNPIIVKFQTYKTVSGSGYGYYDIDNSFVENRQLLEPNSYVTDLAAETKKFKLANEEDFYIDENGYIKAKPVTSVAELIGKSAPNASRCPELTISTEEELIQLATWVNNADKNTDKVLKDITFKLIADITLTDAFTAPIGKGFGDYDDSEEPDKHRAFWATFDGDGHTISNLNTNNYPSGTTVYPALFGNIAGIVKNLKVGGFSTCGGIAGCVCGNGLIEYCENMVEINGTNDAGGIVANTRSGSIRHCVNSGKITSTGDNVGGIVGDCSQSGLVIDDCVNNGEVNGHRKVGGIVGQFFGGTATNCANMNNVTGTGENVGGIAGLTYYYIDGEGINNCYNMGNITGSGAVGGILGVGNLAANVTVMNCYNMGSVSASSTYGAAGCIVGSINKPAGDNGVLTIRNDFYLENTTVTIGIGGTVPSGVTQPNSFSTNSLGTLLINLNNWVNQNNGSGNKYKSWEADKNGYPVFVAE